VKEKKQLNPLNKKASMKKITWHPALFMMLFYLSCQSHVDKQADAATAAKDSAIAKTDSSESGVVSNDQVAASSYGIDTYRKEAVDMVRQALRDKFKSDLDNHVIDSRSRTFTLFEYDLNDDGKKEIFVGLTGSYFCGTGGCNVWLLNAEGKQITEFTVTTTPIVVSKSRTNNWNDLFINSRGVWHIVKFKGDQYPSNPSVQPASKLIPGDDLPRLLDTEHEPYPKFAF